MRQIVDGQFPVRSACENARGGEPLWSEAFADKENNAEGLLHDPVLEIKNAQRGEDKEAEQREQLVAPFHGGDSAARLGGCQLCRPSDLLVRPLSGGRAAVWQ